jgi:hypothetical protein
MRIAELGNAARYSRRMKDSKAYDEHSKGFQGRRFSRSQSERGLARGGSPSRHGLREQRHPPMRRGVALTHVVVLGQPVAGKAFAPRSNPVYTKPDKRLIRDPTESARRYRQVGSAKTPRHKVLGGDVATWLNR